MYKVSSHSNHFIVKAARPRAFPIVGTTSNGEPPSKRNPSEQDNFPQSPREVMTSPKPVFRKSPTKQNCQNGQPPHLSQSHEEMLRFVQATWQKVMQEYELAREQGNNKVIYYDNVSKNTNSGPSDFKPVDLETWYVRRMLTNMDIDPSITP